MPSLKDQAADPAKRRAIIDDAAQLLDAEVAEKRGLSGLAVKAAFKAVKGVSPRMIPMSIDALLDDFCDAVDPFWAECQSSGAAPRPFFGQRAAAVANALLQITDARARRSKQRILKGAYAKLRGQAANHITVAMPRLADLISHNAN